MRREVLGSSTETIVVAVPSSERSIVMNGNSSLFPVVGGNNGNEDEESEDQYRDIMGGHDPSIVSNGEEETHNPTRRFYNSQRESILQRLSEALLRRSLTKMDLSQRGLQPSDARLVKMALLQNSHLTVLKLGYNNLQNHGVCLLADGISKHKALQSLDLGFNNIGDEGCCALAKAIRSPPLRTLYLAGNLFRQEGAIALADLIRTGSSLHKLYLTGNCLGPDGVTAITDAIQEDEHRIAASYEASLQLFRKAKNGEKALLTDTEIPDNSHGLEELFLGGTAMGSEGSRSVAKLLRVTTHLTVISLPNCELNDDDIAELSYSLKIRRDKLPLRSLQLSFNQISPKGVEHLVNALWGSTTLEELFIDNNDIGDRGAQHLAAVLTYLPNLAQVDVGFNGIKVVGMKHLMTAVAETKNLKMLSLSGNAIDSSSAKSVAYALAFNRSLLSLNLVNCSTDPNILRQLAAGIVSNSQVAIRELMGFELGPLVVSLGFPDAVGHWTNEQVLNFLHTMWENYGNGIENGSSCEAEEKSFDPLHFLPGNDSNKPAPIPAATVVEVAQKAFDSLVRDKGYDVFSRRPGHPKENFASASPLPRNHTFVVMDSDGDNMRDEEDLTSSSSAGHISSNNYAKSFVAPPELSTTSQSLPDPGRKRRIVEWLCKNIQTLNKLAQQPFSSAELWRLHQHYFTPVVNESGGPLTHSLSSALKQPIMSEPGNFTISSVPEVSRSSTNASVDASESIEDTCGVTISDPSMKQSPSALGSFSMLKRKVSYRFLGDAALSYPDTALRAAANSSHPTPFTLSTNAVSSMPRKTKRARRNRSRISFLPRIKAKIESQLDVCHEKALVVMRQLYYVEQAILAGQVNPVDPFAPRSLHLSADFAADAEMIIMDMI